MMPELPPVATGIIAFAFGDTILPEVQATVGGNAKTVMYKVRPIHVIVVLLGKFLLDIT